MNGVTINGKHSYNDLGMVLTSVYIGQPEVKTHYIDVPGRALPIDATEAVYGGVRYGNRTISLSFAVKHDFKQFHQAYSRLANLWHGRKVKVAFDTDPASYYMGRAVVAASKTIKGIDQVDVTITAEPWKYYTIRPTGDYLWDSLNFETDILQNLSDIQISANVMESVEVTAGDRPLTPTVTATKAMTVTAKGKTYQLQAGEPQEIPIVIYREAAVLAFQSTAAGSVSITFRGESL